MKPVMLGALLGLLLSLPSQAATTPLDMTSRAYQDGLRDRNSSNTWFLGLSGKTGEGARFWAEHRNQGTGSACADGASNGDEWLAGCVEAKRRLTPVDARRKGETQYWNGWNKVGVEVTTETKTVEASPPLKKVDPRQHDNTEVNGNTDTNTPSSDTKRMFGENVGRWDVTGDMGQVLSGCFVHSRDIRNSNFVYSILRLSKNDDFAIAGMIDVNLPSGDYKVRLSFSRGITMSGTAIMTDDDHKIMIGTFEDDNMNFGKQMREEQNLHIEFHKGGRTLASSDVNMNGGAAAMDSLLRCLDKTFGLRTEKK